MGVILGPLFILIIVLSIELFRTIAKYKEDDKCLASILGIILGLGGCIVEIFLIVEDNNRIGAFITEFTSIFITIPLLILIIILSFIKNTTVRKINYILSVGVLSFFLISFFVSSVVYEFLGIDIYY